MWSGNVEIVCLFNVAITSSDNLQSFTVLQVCVWNSIGAKERFDFRFNFRVDF